MSTVTAENRGNNAGENKPQKKKAKSETPCLALEFLFCRDHVVFEYLNTKEISAFFHAAISSATYRGKVVQRMETFVVSERERIGRFLRQIQSSEKLLAFCHEKASALLQSDAMLSVDYIRKFSEWCIVLDYCDFSWSWTPTIPMNGRDNLRKCWPVGVGRLGESKSHVLLSTPFWSPEIFFLADQWFSEDTSTMQSMLQIEGFPVDGDVNDCLGILSWKDDKYLRVMHISHDIGPLLETHVNQHGELIWLTKGTCDLFENIRPTIDASEKHRWLLDGTEEDDSNMLCFWEIANDGVPAGHENMLVDRIRRVTEEVEKTWRDKED
jgi:hypothetical protein